MVDISNLRSGTHLIESGFQKMDEGGVIVYVSSVDQALLAEEAGAIAISVIYKIPADLRLQASVARMTDLEILSEIKEHVSIPVIGMVRVGHFAEAEILQSAGVNMIDESEYLTISDPVYHIDKSNYETPFISGAKQLGEALRRINEGASMIRIGGAYGTGDISDSVKHMNRLMGDIRSLRGKDKDELLRYAREIEAPPEILVETAVLQRLPVVTYASDGISTPADAVMMMKLGADGIFVGSGIFKSEKPKEMAHAIVQAVSHYNEPEILAEICKKTGSGMKGNPVA